MKEGDWVMVTNSSHEFFNGMLGILFLADLGVYSVYKYKVNNIPFKESELSPLPESLQIILELEEK